MELPLLCTVVDAESCVGAVQLPQERQLALPHHVRFATKLLLQPEFWTNAAVSHWLAMSAMTKPRNHVQRLISGVVLYLEPQVLHEPRQELKREQKAAMERICRAHRALRDAEQNSAPKSAVRRGRHMLDVSACGSEPSLSERTVRQDQPARYS